MRHLTTAIGLSLAVALPAAACPVCHTGTGAEVRAGLADGNVALNLLATLTPFAVAALVTSLCHFGLPWRNRKHDDRH
jgi:hypothetical protein